MPSAVRTEDYLFCLLGIFGFGFLPNPNIPIDVGVLGFVALLRFGVFAKEITFLLQYPPCPKIMPASLNVKIKTWKQEHCYAPAA